MSDIGIIIAVLGFALALAAHATGTVIFIARYVMRIEVRLALIEQHLSQEVPATRGVRPLSDRRFRL